MTNRKIWSIEQLKTAINNNYTVADVLRELGLKVFTGNYQTIYKYVEMLNIDISHLTGKISNSSNLRKKYL
jgi:hypothetical protein